MYVYIYTWLQNLIYQSPAQTFPTGQHVASPIHRARPASVCRAPWTAAAIESWSSGASPAARGASSEVPRGDMGYSTRGVPFQEPVFYN